MRQSRSWSKLTNIPNLIASKAIDFTMFENGTIIPAEFHRDFDKVNGTNIARGMSQPIKLHYYGLTYDAIIENYIRKNLDSTTFYRIRYSAKSDLMKLIKQKFKFSYNYIELKRAQEKANGAKKLNVRVPQQFEEHLDFIATGKPFEYELNFRTYNEDAQTDEEFQEIIQQTPPLSTYNILDEPKPKQHKISSERVLYDRDPKVAIHSLAHANYLCEGVGEHAYFTSKTTNQNYVEAHHLVPLAFQDLFTYSLDVEANVVSLCVSCHKKLHHALFQEKERLLEHLLGTRQTRLKLCGIHVTQDQLKLLYE